MTRPLECQYRQLPCADCVEHGCRTPSDRAQRHAEQDVARVRRVCGWLFAGVGGADVVFAVAGVVGDPDRPRPGCGRHVVRRVADAGPGGVLVSLVNVYSARREAEVMSDTWGHLAPEKGRTYHGTILFTHGEYGDIVPIKARFDDLPDSPWFFDDLNDFLFGLDTQAGTVYRFEGSYCRQGAPQFVGDIRAVAR